MIRTIAVDVDSVCAALSPVWCAWYNRDWDDNLQPEDIKAWGTHEFVKPECGLKIYEYIENPKIYDEVKPIKGSQEGVKKLREMGFDIVFATTSTVGTMGRKYHWLVEYGFTDSLKEYIEIGRKELLRVEYLLDDNYSTIEKFPGCGILFLQPWNAVFRFSTICAKNWEDFISIMSPVMRWKDNLTQS